MVTQKTTTDKSLCSLKQAWVFIWGKPCKSPTHASVVPTYGQGPHLYPRHDREIPNYDYLSQGYRTSCAQCEQVQDLYTFPGNTRKVRWCLLFKVLLTQTARNGPSVVVGDTTTGGFCALVASSGRGGWARAHALHKLLARLL